MSTSAPDGPTEPRSNDADPSAERAADAERLPWVGYWRVRRYDGAAPSVPTFYEATPESWDVLKAEASGLHVARHPILDIHTEAAGTRLVLKDEGAPDEEAEQWEVAVEGDQLRVHATTGPHAGAIGIAERMATDPREQEAQV